MENNIESKFRNKLSINKFRNKSSINKSGYKFFFILTWGCQMNEGKKNKNMNYL